MKFRTEITSHPSNVAINHSHRIVLLGSCFVENIGKMLQQYKFNVAINPFGIIYNPLSISEALWLLLGNKEFTEEDLFQNEGLWHSFNHHSRFSNSGKMRSLHNINASLRQASQDILNADILFITLGTAIVYQHKDSGLIVANCHKLPAYNFDRYRLQVATIVTEWTKLIHELKKRNPKLKVVFTISPIRHISDGLHENQLSKSTLLLAVEELCRLNEDISYFPAYEIVLDDLRDYRFYKEDMLHPNSVAIHYIWEKLSETYFTQQTAQIIDECSKIQAAIAHRAFNEESEAHQLFLNRTILKIQHFNNKYPYICYAQELAELEARIIRR